METKRSKHGMPRKLASVAGCILLLLGTWLFGYVTGSKRQSDFDAYGSNFLLMYTSYLIGDSLNSGRLEDALRTARVETRAAFPRFQRSPLRGNKWHVPYIAWEEGDPFFFYYHEPEGIERRVEQVRKFLAEEDRKEKEMSDRLRSQRKTN